MPIPVLTNQQVFEETGELLIAQGTTNDGRLFLPGERYTYDQRITGGEVCGSCGGKYVEARVYYRVTIEERHYYLRSNWVTLIPASEPVRETLNERMYQIANQSNDPAPDTYRPDEQLARFNRMAKDGPSTQEPL